MHEYIEPTSAGRLRLLAIFALWALVFAIGQFVPFPYVDSLPPCESIAWTKALLLSGSLLYAGVALWVIWPAWQTGHSRQYPHPGADVFFRSRVVRGWRVAAYVAARLTTFLLLGWLAIKLGPLVVQGISAASMRCAA
jgi:hypothetical protein